MKKFAEVLFIFIVVGLIGAGAWVYLTYPIVLISYPDGEIKAVQVKGEYKDPEYYQEIYQRRYVIEHVSPDWEIPR